MIPGGVKSGATKIFGKKPATADSFIGTAEICRPPDNFFDAVLIGSLADAFEWLVGQGTRAIILCTEDKNFRAGADLTRPRSSPVNIGSGAGGPDQHALRLFAAAIPA